MYNTQDGDLKKDYKDLLKDLIDGRVPKQTQSTTNLPVLRKIATPQAPLTWRAD
jgi:hypothetical protein